MSGVRPYVREGGAGDGVVCLHANASTSGQWQALIERLSPRWHVVAPDAYGSGKTAEWPSDRVIALADEVALIEPVLADAAPAVVVGHSYGAAVALMAANTFPERVRALALYEPTLFALVEADTPPPNDVDAIRAVVAAAGAALDANDHDTAARLFIDYWMGEGSFAAMPERRRPAIAASTANVRRWGHALTTERTPLDAFRRLDVPVLYMVGKRSPRSAHAVAERLIPALPRVRVVEFEALGHMGPITHPDVVNDAIERFVAAV